MITINNYKDTVKDLDYSTLPATYWKTHQFIEKASENYTNWNAYNSNDGIKKLMDTYFVKLDEFIQKNPITQKHDMPKNIHVVRIDNSQSENKSEVVKPKESHKIVKQTIPTPDETEEMDLTFVERIPEEIKFLKRYVAMNNKRKTKDDLLRFINALQRSIVEKRIRKTSPYAKQIKYIQEKLLARFNDMAKNTLIIIDEKIVLEFKNLIAQERVMPSIMLIKRYITLNGKYGVKEKAQALINAMQKAVKLKKITKNDKYNKLLDEMHSNLNSYIKSKTQKVLNIAPAELNGINGVLGCACELSGINEELAEVNCIERDTEPVKPILPKGVMSSMDFSNVQFKTLGFVGKYRKLIGDPSKGFSAMVYGKPKMGKSFLCVDFAGYLARNHGKVLYIAREEGLDMTLQEKLKAKDVAHPNLFVTEQIPEDLSYYDFIFFDSVNKLGLSSGDLETLKHNNPGKSFVYIFQTTKEGNFRGANEFQHDVDVVIQVPEKGLAVQNGRFNQGGEMRIFEDAEYRNAA